MKEKILAPCVIACVMILYFFAVISEFYGFFSNPIWGAVCFLLLLGGVHLMISVTKERIDEIRSGEEDDLSQY